MNTNSPDILHLKNKQRQDAQAVADSVDLGSLDMGTEGTGPPLSGAVYYFHPDHLGSSTVISDFSGYAYQIFLNLPFGETMAEQRRTGTFDNIYKFNAKELDSEIDEGDSPIPLKNNNKTYRQTGLYYYGARYYDPRTSVWLSVDPLAEKASNWSPYRYGFQNPIKYTDPTGMWEDDYKLGDDGNITKIRDTNDEFDRVYNSDQSNFVQLEKGIIGKGITANVPEKRFFGFLWKIQEASKHTTYVSSNTDDLIDLHRFITDNASVEYSYQQFQNTNTGNSVGILATDYEKSSVGFGNVIGAKLLFKNPNLIMTKDRHNHPRGTLYPSGFIEHGAKYEMIPDYSSSDGDRGSYEYFQRNFPGRIPSTFDIIVPNSSDRVIYNADTMRVIKISIGELEIQGTN